MNTLNLMKIALRLKVCVGCFRSASVPEGAATTDPRACEPDCEIFYYLPRLAAMVRRFGGEPPCGYPLAVLNLPCRACGTGRQCGSCANDRPLGRYASEALALIEEIEGTSARALAFVQPAIR